MNDFPEAEAFALAEKAFPTARTVDYVLERYAYLQGYRAAWTKAQGEMAKANEGLRVLQELTESKNELNPWLGVCAAVSLFRSAVDSFESTEAKLKIAIDGIQKIRSYSLGSKADICDEMLAKIGVRNDK